MMNALDALREIKARKATGQAPMAQADIDRQTSTVERALAMIEAPVWSHATKTRADAIALTERMIAHVLDPVAAAGFSDRLAKVTAPVNDPERSRRADATLGPPMMRRDGRTASALCVAVHQAVESGATVQALEAVIRKFVDACDLPNGYTDPLDSYAEESILYMKAYLTGKCRMNRSINRILTRDDAMKGASSDA
ncbi:MAG: hypothetical protein P4L33_04230 [Capsulimonadaceae bacterium]|nr:hypothetical protein [Capsulimonadaceae bacterium]